MPEIDLPTVIFALVALFVAWKLRSVLGMRQDSERPGELMAPLRRAPGPAGAPVAQPDAAPSAPVSQAPADRWKGVAEPNPAVWSGLDAIAARGSQLLAAKPFCPALAALTIWSSTLSPPEIPTPSKA